MSGERGRLAVVDPVRERGTGPECSGEVRDLLVVRHGAARPFLGELRDLPHPGCRRQLKLREPGCALLIESRGGVRLVPENVRVALLDTGGIHHRLGLLVEIQAPRCSVHPIIRRVVEVDPLGRDPERGQPHPGVGADGEGRGARRHFTPLEIHPRSGAQECPGRLVRRVASGDVVDLQVVKVHRRQAHPVTVLEAGDREEHVAALLLEISPELRQRRDVLLRVERRHDRVAVGIADRRLGWIQQGLGADRRSPGERKGHGTADRTTPQHRVRP